METAPYRLSMNHPMNVHLLAHMALRYRDLVPIAGPNSSEKDPYRELGSPPDTVSRVWDEIGSALAPVCRCLLYGRPALVAPTSGVVLAVTWGMPYIINVPPSAVPIAKKLRGDFMARMVEDGKIDVTKEFGVGWIFGCWLMEELAWCQQVFGAVGH
jgi:hypothetical protein